MWDFTKLTAVDPSYLELYTSCMDVEVVAGDGSTGSPAATTSANAAPAPPPAQSGATRITRTNYYTTTVTGATLTVTDTATPAVPTGNVNVKTVFSTTFITITRTM